MLIEQLPQESRTQTALRDQHQFDPLEPAEGPQQFGPWSLDNFQLARLTDAVRELTFITAVAGQIEPKPTFPEPEPRPGMYRPAAVQPQANILYLDSLRAKG